MNEDVFAVSILSGTEMGCGNGLMEQDTWLVSFFTSSPTVEHNGDTLIIANNEATLTFIDDEIANPDQPLTGLTWLIDTYIDGEVATAYNLEELPTLIFSDDGSIIIDTGCNGVGGNYTITGDEIIFDLEDISLMACEEDINQIESHILTVLNSPVIYNIDSNRLTLDNPSTNKGFSAYIEE